MSKDWYKGGAGKKGDAAPSRREETHRRHADDRRSMRARHTRERREVDDRQEEEIARLAASHDAEATKDNETNTATAGTSGSASAAYPNLPQ